MFQIKPNGKSNNFPEYPDYVLKGKTKFTEDNLPEVKFIKINDLPPPNAERLDELRKQVLYLKSIPQPKQRSPEWFSTREKMITASVWGSVLKQNKYSYRNAVVLQKCGHPSYQFKGNVYTEWGKKYEDAAIKIYEKRNQVEVWEFGVIPHPHFKFLGASPDGITPDGVMVEIKCPPRRTITGEVPEQYWCQIQGQLEVCKLDRCDFLECKLEEYKSEDHTYCDEYFNDNYKGDHTLTSLGMEKGIVIVMMDKKTTELSYYHSELGLNPEEYILWKEETINKVKEENAGMIYVESSFWKLTRVSCVPVFRDIHWFYCSLPRLRRCWEDIEYFRKVGYQKLVKGTCKSVSDVTTIDITKYLKVIDDPKDKEDGPSTDAINEYNDIKKFKGISMFSESTVQTPSDDEEASSSQSTKTTKKSISLFSTPTKKTKPASVSLFSSNKPEQIQQQTDKVTQELTKLTKKVDQISKDQISKDQISKEKSKSKSKSKAKKCPACQEISSVLKEIRQIQSRLVKISEILSNHPGNN